jgi:hypothetical protein
VKPLSPVPALAALFLPLAALGQDSKPDLSTFAEQAAKQKSIEIWTPAFDLAGVNLRYDLGGWGVGDPGKPEPLDLVLRQVLRVAAIRGDTSEVAKKYLAPDLGKVEGVIREMVADLESAGANKKVALDRLGKKESEIDDIFVAGLERAAKALDKKEVTADRPAKEYRVDLATDPDGGTIECMPAGRWELYRFLRDQGRKVAEPDWTPMVRTTQVPLVGKYQFRVTWPTGARFEGVVEVRGKDPLRFKQPTK